MNIFYYSDLSFFKFIEICCLFGYIYIIFLYDNFVYIKMVIKDLFCELLFDLIEYICYIDNVKFKWFNFKVNLYD